MTKTRHMVHYGKNDVTHKTGSTRRIALSAEDDQATGNVQKISLSLDVLCSF